MKLDLKFLVGGRLRLRRTGIVAGFSFSAFIIITMVHGKPTRIVNTQ